MLNWVVVGVGDIAVRRVIPAIQAESRSHLYGIVTRDLAKAAPWNTRAWTNLGEAVSETAVHAVYVDDSGPARGQARVMREAHG